MFEGLFHPNYIKTHLSVSVVVSGNVDMFYVPVKLSKLNIFLEATSSVLRRMHRPGTISLAESVSNKNCSHCVMWIT